MIDSHVRKRRLVPFTGVLMGVPFVATLGIAAIILVNSVGQPLWVSWSAYSARLAKEEARGVLIENEAREQTYRALCPTYLEASYFNRWMRYRDFRWCKSFKDRMP